MCIGRYIDNVARIDDPYTSKWPTYGILMGGYHTIRHMGLIRPRACPPSCTPAFPQKPVAPHGSLVQDQASFLAGTCSVQAGIIERIARVASEPACLQT